MRNSLLKMARHYLIYHLERTAQLELAVDCLQGIPYLVKAFERPEWDTFLDSY